MKKIEMMMGKIIMYKITEEKGFSYIEVLVALAIFVLCLIFMLQAVSIIYENIVKERIYFLGTEIVHEKIEQYRALKYSEIEAGEYYDQYYNFIERRLLVERIGKEIKICISTYSNAGRKLYEYCIKKDKNE